MQPMFRHEFAMSLRLVMVRTVAGVDVANAFDDTLRPRVKAVSADCGDLEALERFRGYFAAPEIATGTEVVFAYTPAGRLSTSVAGAEAGEHRLAGPVPGAVRRVSRQGADLGRG